MMEVGALETIADFGTGLFVCVFSAVVEVVSGGTYNNDESTAVVNEGGEPQKSEEHVKTEVPVLFGPHQVFNLWGKGTWSDLIQGGNANICTEPNDNNYEGQEEMNDWNCNDSLIVGNEVSRCVNNIDGSLEALSSAADQ
jgi:hypothetical protein